MAQQQQNEWLRLKDEKAGLQKQADEIAEQYRGIVEEMKSRFLPLQRRKYMAEIKCRPVCGGGGAAFGLCGTEPVL